EQAGQADRRMRAAVEGQQQQLEMRKRATRTGRGEARDRRQHLVGDRADNLLDLGPARSCEERGETCILEVAAERRAEAGAGDAEGVAGACVAGEHENVAEQSAHSVRVDIAAFRRPRVASLAVPIVEKFPTGWMFHGSNSPWRPHHRHTSVPLSRTPVPEIGCAGGTVQRPCRSTAPRRFCGVNVKLTMWFAAARRTAMVASFRFAGFLQVPAEAYTGGVKQIGHCRRGEGWGYLGPRTAQKTTEVREGVLSTLPFICSGHLSVSLLRCSAIAGRCRAGGPMPLRIQWLTFARIAPWDTGPNI